MKLKIFSFTFIFILISSITFAYAETFSKTNNSDSQIDYTAAEDNFRRGVQSYYRGSYNEAILEFEKALSNLPNESLILDWLGKAYYKAGIEGTALMQWNSAKEKRIESLLSENNNDDANLNINDKVFLLDNKIEIVTDRRVINFENDLKQKFTECGAISGVYNKNLIFSQPVSSLPNNDGSVWVVAYGTNEIILFDVNGQVVSRNRGPINGFDRPIDIIRLKDSNLLVSESAGNRLALLDSNGRFIKYLGEKGRKNGQLIGPQYLAQDSNENIYVTDFGNSRVVVFNKEGTGILSFANKTNFFKGLKAPSGIAIINDRVFVCDSVYGAIYEFDTAGNFIGNLVEEKTLRKPEAMKSFDSYLIITDKNRVLVIDSETGEIFENGKTGQAGTYITSAVPDVNGNIIVTDLKANEVYIMTKMSELVGGLFVQIERVNSDAFPQITLEVKIENRKRQPIVGLKQENFLITENKRTVTNYTLSGQASNNDTADLVFVLARNSSMKNYEDRVESAIKEICASTDERANVAIISAGNIPVLEAYGNARKFNDFEMKNIQTPYTNEVSLDLSLRLATNRLINAEKKRAVIFITDSSQDSSKFSKYSFSDISNFMNNNSVIFSAVTVNQKSLLDEIKYIADTTNGEEYYVFRPQGLSTLFSDILNVPNGLYQLKYTSSLTTEYGKKYLPVEVETYLLNRSGRDETGYFAPLQ